MSEPPGIQHPLGIESVEFSSVGGRELLVRVIGRWRRRRPSTGGRPLLIVEAEGRRHRFPALPEPPSVSGASPGLWRVAFFVPAWLAPALAGRLTLLVGGVSIPLPPAAAAAERETAARPSRSPAAPAEPASEPASEPALAHRFRELEERLEEAEREPERLRGLLADQERVNRRNEQRIHAERAQRDELERALDELDLRLEQERRQAHAVEKELEALRRRVDEAEQALELARAAARRADERLRDVLATSPQARVLRTELELAGRSVTVVREPPPGPISPARPAYARELAFRVARDRASQPAAGDLSDLAQREVASRAWEAIEELRGQLDALRAAHAGVAPPVAAPPDLPPAPDPHAGETLEPERLSAALARLREAAAPETAAEPEESDQSAVPWLPNGIRGLAARDPVAAGRVIVDLLGAQHVIHPDPLAYDVVLADGGIFAVTVRTDGTDVERTAHRRSATSLAFIVNGDLAGLARLLTRGRLRRALTRRKAAVSGRGTDAPLRALVRAPLSLSELEAAGVRFNPATSLLLASAVIDQAWTREERFTIGHVVAPGHPERTYLQVRDGGPLAVLREPPLAPVATTIVCPRESLLLALAGAPDAAGSIRGDQRPLTLVKGWLERAGVR